MRNINKGLNLMLDQDYFLKKETYDESFIKSFEKLSFTDKNLYNELFNMINLHLKEYSTTWSLLKFRKEDYNTDNFKFYKSCFEVILIDLTFIYANLFNNNLKIFNSELFELLNFHIEKSLENETKLFSIIKDLDYDKIYKSRIVSNFKLLTILLGKNQEQMIDRTYFLFNQLLDPLELNEFNYLDLRDLANTNKELEATVFMFVPIFIQTVKLHILDRLESKQN